MACRKLHGRPCFFLCTWTCLGSCCPCACCKLACVSCARCGPQGRELGVFEPNALANHDLALSADGRFIAVASFSADVKVWEMKYTREGEFRGELPGSYPAATGHYPCGTCVSSAATESPYGRALTSCLFVLQAA